MSEMDDLLNVNEGRESILNTSVNCEGLQRLSTELFLPLDRVVPLKRPGNAALRGEDTRSSQGLSVHEFDD